MTLSAKASNGSTLHFRLGDCLVLETGLGERHQAELQEGLGTINPFHWQPVACCPAAHVGSDGKRSCGALAPGEYWVLREVGGNEPTFEAAMRHAPPRECLVMMGDGQRHALFRLMERLVRDSPFHLAQVECCSGPNETSCDSPDLPPLPCGSYPGGDYAVLRLLD